MQIQEQQEEITQAGDRKGLQSKEKDSKITLT